jgi:hypothetical protein
MSYTLKLHNSTGSLLDASDGQQIKPGGTWTGKELGNAYFHSDEVGSLSFRDIGEDHIGGDSKETWGVLVAYQGSHLVGRYEGDNGELDITWDKFLQVIVAGKMSLRLVQLNSLVPALKKARVRKK